MQRSGQNVIIAIWLALGKQRVTLCQIFAYCDILYIYRKNVRNCQIDWKGKSNVTMCDLYFNHFHCERQDRMSQIDIWFALGKQDANLWHLHSHCDILCIKENCHKLPIWLWVLLPSVTFTLTMWQFNCKGQSMQNVTNCYCTCEGLSSNWNIFP